MLYPFTNRGDLDGMTHVAAFACLTTCRAASTFEGEACRARFRRSTKRSLVGQVHTRCDATQYVQFGRSSSHFFFRFRHVRQPVFVRKDACEIGDDFIMGQTMHQRELGCHDIVPSANAYSLLREKDCSDESARKTRLLRLLTGWRGWMLHLFQPSTSRSRGCGVRGYLGIAAQSVMIGRILRYRALTRDRAALNPVYLRVLVLCRANVA